jgi:Predicted integral membrane protein
MDPITSAVLGVLMRWVHILSAITLLGGMIYRRFVLVPSTEIPSEEERRRSRRWIALAVIGLVLSGLYNLASKSNIPPGYPLFFSLKLLLAMHVIAVAFLLNRASIQQHKRNRMITGVVISGMAIVLLSAYLRYLSNWMTP